ncbi:unnamed protein product [Auanema sp. JU1783]|nr:unnamed protein product [Auanema sp. JU1783]
MDDARKKISKGVLDMRFMQKTKQRLQRNANKKIEELKNENLLEDSEIKHEPTVEFSTDITSLEGLKFGRMSYKGFNEEVEKLMVYHERIRNGEDSEESEDDEEVDVQDKEMASALGGQGSEAIRKKFASKHDRLMLMDQQARGKLNFDPASIRKRVVDKSWAEASTSSKFMKPNDE